MSSTNVDLDEAILDIESFGTVTDTFLTANSVKLTTMEHFIEDIADEETVQWIDVIEKICQAHRQGKLHG